MLVKIGTEAAVRQTTLLKRITDGFSSSKGKGKKVQTIGFTSNNIENIKSLGFKATGPISYTDGRYLIYKSRASLKRSAKDYSLHGASISYLSYCLYFHVNLVNFPILKHIYIASMGITLFFTARRFLRNQSIVKEIYLLQGGRASEIVYQNSTKRKWFGESLKETYYNSLFAEPREDQETWKASNFPTEVGQFKEAMLMSSYWRKCFRNEQNQVLIPVDYEYINAEILINVMQGKVILL